MLFISQLSSFVFHSLLTHFPTLSLFYSSGSPYWPDLEKNLKAWVEHERSLGKTITSFHIKIEALRMARERNINNFSGTKKWCYSFMRRNQIPARSRKKRSPDGKSSNPANDDPSTSI